MHHMATIQHHKLDSQQKKTDTDIIYVKSRVFHVYM